MADRKKTIHILPLALLVLVTVLSSSPTVHFGYLLEDYKYLRPYSLPEIARTFYSHWDPLEIETKGYRPLHAVQYGFFYCVFGGDPVVNHIFQIALFTAGVLLIYVMVLRYTAGTTAAFWTALVYPCLATTAWHVTHFCNRQHLLIIVFLAVAVIFYDKFLLRRSRLAWLVSWLAAILALLTKESAAAGPLILFLYATVIRRKSIRSQLKPLAPYFLALALFIVIRAIILKDVPASNPDPPPLDLHPANVISVYYRALRGSFIQTQGIHDPKNDFPMYDLGLKTTRDYTGLAAFLGFFAAGIFLLLRRSSQTEKRGFIFGLGFLLITNILVTAWYRTNRLFLNSIGVALMAGILVSVILKTLTNRKNPLERAAGALAGCSFLLYLSLNIAVYYEIQWAQRPDGFIALTWDRWDYEEYFERLDDRGVRIITGDQMRYFQEKLRWTGRAEWADELENTIAR